MESHGGRRQNPMPRGGAILGVWRSGSSDMWAVGRSGAVVHWTGSAWPNVWSITTRDLFGVGGTAATDVRIVGDGGAIVNRL